MAIKNLFIILISNNTLEIISELQRYHKKGVEKGKQYYKENKERLHKMAYDSYKEEKKKVW